LTLFADILLTWYAAHQRELPWRNISDPYRIWVSEIILQQTRIAQGRAYYERFVRAFPTVEALAKADEDAVLRAWQGLGYYTRARNLHKAAQQVVAMGGFPRTYSEVRRLAGVGDYTASAICSFAYGQPVAAMDGNAYRVLSRYFGIAAPIDTARGKELFAAIAREQLPQKRSADYNQAVMDFGAMLCTPASPRCDVCPLAETCQARAAGNAGNLPVKAHRITPKRRHLIYIGVKTPAGLWLHKRAAGDIWAGLYDFVLLETERKLTFQELLAEPTIQHLPPRGTWQMLREDIRHQLTHQTICADVYALTYTVAAPPPEGFIVAAPDEISRYALPKLLADLIPLLYP